MVEQEFHGCQVAKGAVWAFVTVDPRLRRQGIGTALGAKLVEHLRETGATKATCLPLDRGGRALGRRAGMIAAGLRPADRG
jgi:GNAT superfamily N-acetyltransferase